MKKLHLICNSHIDPVWMWDWEEGFATAISTFYQAAEFMNVPYALNYFPHGLMPAGETLENRLIIENKEVSLVAFYQDGDRYILRLLNNQDKQTTAEISLCGVNYTTTFGKYEVKTLCYIDGVLNEQAYIC